MDSMSRLILASSRVRPVEKVARSPEARKPRRNGGGGRGKGLETVRTLPPSPCSISLTWRRRAPALLRLHLLGLGRYRLRNERRRRAGRLLRRWRRRLESLGRRHLDLRVAVDAGARRDQVPDDDVLLEPQQVILGALDGGVRQHPRGLLERRRRNERLRRERRLGDP